MKKLLASALLAGLMLGTTTQVFAETAEQPEQKINVSSTFETKYLVTIPGDLTITLEDGSYLFNDDTGEVILSNLNTIGEVKVTAIASDMRLNDQPNDARKTLNTLISSGEDHASATQETIFSLSNKEEQKSKHITVLTNDDSTTKYAGTYSGTVTFNFEYVAPAE